MNDVSSEKPAPGDAVAHGRRGFDWPHALVELAIVVVGILIALAINNWTEAGSRHYGRRLWIRSVAIRASKRFCKKSFLRSNDD